MAFRYTKPQILADWRSWFANRKDDAEYKRRIYDIYFPMAETAGELDVVEEMLDDVMETSRRLVKYAQSHCPVAFLHPSWEQAQIINAWHPDYEPEIASNGYQSVAIFSANRIGKTLSLIINTLLWLLPNDPDWPIFQEFEDPPRFNEDGIPESGIARPSRGKYRIHLRPDWAAWRRTGRLIMPGHDDSPMGPCEVWHGVENDTDYNQRIAGEFGGKDGYLAWIPREAVGKRPDGGLAVFKQERTIKTKYGQSIIGRTYNSDVMAWAGKAARIVNMDEGFEQQYLTEATTRVEGGGYFLWAYTPTEARNIGRRSLLAHEAYEGKRELVGKAKFFVDFSMEDAPAQVLDPQKKAADLSRFAKLGGEGKTRAKGGFFQSSPRVFFNFDRDKHILPWNGTEILAAMRGEGDAQVAGAFFQANIIRGFDEGTAHPTTCSWVAILRTGEYVLFREFSETELSVSERCEKIIEMSRNERKISHYHNEESLRRYVEHVPPGAGMIIRRTFADSKIFKRNPEVPQDDWISTYRKNGLKMERATSMGPAGRCDFVNDMFRGDATRMHLVTKERPGYRLYVAVDCEKMVERFQNYLQEQLVSGPNAGQFTGKPQKYGDDEIDSLCYAACSKLKWRDPQEQAAESVRYDSMTGAVIR